MKNQTRNIFIVLTPFQLICAQEAREEFCKEDCNHLIIIERRRKGTVEHTQIECELDKSWQLVTRHREQPKHNAFRILSRIKNTFKIIYLHGIKKGKVFLGDGRISWFRTLGRMLGTEVIWLDDGAATINIISDFKSKGLVNEPNSPIPKLYTIFANDALKIKSNGAIVKNNLRTLAKSRRGDQTVAEGKAMFIGQWLSEQGVIDVGYEVALLAKTREFFCNWEIKYICHRHEDSKKLNEIGDFFHVCSYKNSIERQLLKEKQVPELIISWYSTALFTLRELFPEARIVSIELPQSTIAIHQRKSIGNVYNVLKSLNIEVVSPDDLNNFRDHKSINP